MIATPRTSCELGIVILRTMLRDLREMTKCRTVVSRVQSKNILFRSGTTLARGYRDSGAKDVHDCG